MTLPVRNDIRATHPHPAILIAATNSLIDPDRTAPLYIKNTLIRTVSNNVG